MRDHDQQFFDSFVLVLGVLIGVAVALVFAARSIAINTAGRYELQDPLVQQEIDKRIEPVGRVVMLGAEELKKAQAAAAAAAAPATPGKKLSGHEVFSMVCFACHAPPGAGGAPIVGNKDMWGPRIAKGIPTLEQHALQGFQGQNGFMPPKGGRPDLSDAEIVAAVHYMASQVDPDAVKAAEAKEGQGGASADTGAGGAGAADTGAAGAGAAATQ